MHGLDEGAALTPLGTLPASERAEIAGHPERRESRGAQFREDYPQKSDEYGKFNIVLRKAADGGMQVIRQPVVAMGPDLKQVVEENK